MVRILGVGIPYRDRFALTAEHSLKEKGLAVGETKVSSKEYVEHCWDSVTQLSNTLMLGGSCTNVLKMLELFGHEVSLCGKIGAGNIGDQISKELDARKVKNLCVKGKQEHGVVNCFITKDEAKGIHNRTMQCFLGAAFEFNEGDVQSEYFGGNIDHVHIEGYVSYYGKAMEKALQLAMHHGKTVSMDLSSPEVAKAMGERLRETIKKVDYLFGNLQEMQALTNEKNPEEIVKFFDQKQVVVITDASNGLWIKEAGKAELVKRNAQAVPFNQIVDTTGAGDTCEAGILHGLLSKRTMEYSTDLGQFAASHIIQVLGTEFSADSKVEVLKKANS